MATRRYDRRLMRFGAFLVVSVVLTVMYAAFSHLGGSGSSGANPASAIATLDTNESYGDVMAQMGPACHQGVLADQASIPTLEGATYALWHSSNGYQVVLFGHATSGSISPSGHAGGTLIGAFQSTSRLHPSANLCASGLDLNPYFSSGWLSVI